MNTSNDELRVIANRIRKQAKEQRIIGITSFKKREGKSEFILRMSNFLKDYGKVLIIDYNFFENSLTTGLEEKGLEEKGSEEQYICMTDMPNIYVMSCDERLKIQGYVNIGEMKQMMEAIRHNYEYILVELPSFENFSYVQEISEVIDGIILMVSKGHLQVNQLSTVKEKMDTLMSPVISCVFNENVKKRHKSNKKKVKKQGLPIKVEVNKAVVNV